MMAIVIFHFGYVLLDFPFLPFIVCAIRFSFWIKSNLEKDRYWEIYRPIMFLIKMY